MKHIILIITIFLFPLLANAQASGGQVKRSKQKQSIVAKILNEFVFIEGGELTLENGNKVYVNSFWISEEPISQELWRRVMGYNPSCKKNNNSSVDNISWYDCQRFIKKLNGISKYSFRLPSVEEWEYAANNGMQGDIYEWTVSQNCFSDNHGYGKYSITKNVRCKTLRTATRVLKYKEEDLGFRLVLEKK